MNSQKSSWLLLAALVAQSTVTGRALAQTEAPVAEPAPTPTNEAPQASPAEPAAAAAPTTPAAPAAPATPAAPTTPATPKGNAGPDGNADDAAPLQLDDEQPGAAEAAKNGEPLKIYGFGDVGYRYMLVPKTSPWLVYLNRYPSFFVGNLNFYFDSQLSQRWRALAEVRFTYIPQGAKTGVGNGLEGQQNNTYSDYTNYTRDVSVGGVVIERAFIEYTATPWLTLQAGQWLTPYGIWNVDHGSPVIIGVQAPFIIGAKLLPRSQVGVLAQGSFSVADDTEIGYALGISNGRTDISAYEDLDANKAITARLSLTYRGLGALTLGSTGYTGENSDTNEATYFEGSEPHSREVVKMRQHERAFAFDLRWDYSDLRVQAEAIVNEHKYTDKGRPALNGGLAPDRRDWGGYALVGYRTPLFGIMPYVKGEYSPDRELQDIGIDKNLVLVTGGLNVRPVPRVVFKVEATHGWFPGAAPHTFASSLVSSLDFQTAWVF